MPSDLGDTRHRGQVARCYATGHADERQPVTVALFDALFDALFCRCEKKVSTFHRKLLQCSAVLQAACLLSAICLSLKRQRQRP